MAQPKVTDQELYDIQKFANSGLSTPSVNDGASTSFDQVSKLEGPATSILLDSKVSMRDEVMSTISKNQKERSLLGKR